MKKTYSYIRLIIAIIFSTFLAISSTNAQTGLNAIFNSSTNSYIDYGKSQNLGCITNLIGTNKLTVTMWVKWGSKIATGVGSNSNLFTMADSTGSSNNGVFWVQHNSSNSKFQFDIQTSNGKSTITSNTNPIEGQWYHVACVYNGTNMKMYINGIQESNTGKTGNISTFSSLSKLMMGRNPNPNNNYRKFNGSLDEVSIWKRALTTTEINTLKDNPTNITGILYDAIGLIGYWNFDDNTANDLCICGNNGIIGSDVVLPIELIEFNAKENESTVELNWATGSEINNDFFTIERSSNAKDFEKIGSISGNGNSNSKIEYNFEDNSPLKGISYYRLRQTDFDGKTTVSDMIPINFNLKRSTSITIFPNPSNGENTQLLLSNLETEISTLQIYDYSGKLVFKSEFTGNYFSIPTNLLATGLYTAKIISATEVLSATISIIKK